MSETIQDDKFVELTYRITDNKTGELLVGVEYPIGYVTVKQGVTTDQAS